MEDFNKILKNLKVGVKNKIRLTKRSDYVDVWWETKDKWFLNIKTKKETNSYWVLKPNAVGFLKFLYSDYKLNK